MAVFSPSRDGLWKMLHPESESFQSSMVSSVRQEDIENLLKRVWREDEVFCWRLFAGGG